MWSWFKNLKISVKLIFGFAGVLLTMLIVGLSGIIGIRGVYSNLSAIFSQRLPSLDYVIEADRDLYQLLVAERSMIFADVQSDVFQQFIKEYDENMTQYAERWAKYKELKHADEELPFIEKFDLTRVDWEAISRSIVEARMEDTREGRGLSIDLSLAEGQEKFLEMRECLNQLTEIILAQAAEENSKAKTHYGGTIVMTFLLIGGGAALSLVLMHTISGSVTRPVKTVVAMLHDIAQGKGDLTKRLDVDSNDEMGELAKWFNLFVDKLQKIVLQLKKNTEAVSIASQEISTTSLEMAAGAEEQSQQATEVATSVQEVAAAIVLNSQNANQTADIARLTTFKAQEGTKVMRETQVGMQAIVKSAEGIAKIIQSLINRLDQVGDVVWAIDDIAAQTKVLALNASIEAANAGEEGKGFAIVADEVRSLVGRTTEATQEIVKTLNDIQNDIQLASQSMTEVDQVVSTGQEASKNSESVFSEIVDRVSQAMSMIEQIASVSLEQSSGAEEISKNVAAISSVTRQSANGAEQLASAASSLNLQTVELRNLVSEFVVENGKE